MKSVNLNGVIDGTPYVNESDLVMIKWEKPLLFDEVTAPEIPSSLLPSWLGEFADAVSKSTQTPTGMSVMLALAVIATCVQKQYVVKMSDDYSEALSLWPLVVAVPGERKSPVLKHLVQPIEDWEREQRVLMKRELAEDATNRKVLEERVKELKKKAAKAESHELTVLTAEITDCEEKLLEKPKIAPQLWTGDVTNEKLQSLLADHDGRMSVLSDEGGIFDVMAGLYSNGQANIDCYLKAYSGTSIRVHRGSREVDIPNPALTIGLTVQPSTIAECASGGKKKFRGRGLLGRFLFCKPVSKIGNRDMSQAITIPAEIKHRYNFEICQLLNKSHHKSGNVSVFLTLSAAARDLHVEFAQRLESKIGEGRPLYPIQDWASKLAGQTLRIAGLMHLVISPDTATIEKDTMANAIQLAELCIPHAQSVLQSLAADPATEDAKYIFNWVTLQGESSFRQTDVFNLSRFKPFSAERLKSAIRLLVERNIVHGRDGAIAQKQPYVYLVNPAILDLQNPSKLERLERLESYPNVYSMKPETTVVAETA